MRMMLENLVGPDMQQKMLSQLDPSKLVDPEIHSFLQERLQAMGIDVSHLLQTQPKTYELLQLLYCCNVTSDMGIP